MLVVKGVMLRLPELFFSLAFLGSGIGLAFSVGFKGGHPALFAGLAVFFAIALLFVKESYRRLK
jgi:hypothetical protein